MAARTQSEIIIDLITDILSEQPTADVMPGQVLRDIVVNSNAAQMEDIYNQIENISTAQSISNANFMTNQQLDNLLGNFGIQRRGASKSIGTARFYTSVLPTQVVTIPENTILTAQSASTGQNINFLSTATQVFDPSNGGGAYLVTDVSTYYAIDVSIIAQTAGSAGNVGAYTITTVNGLNLPFQVTNPTATSGGSDQESNNDFATRALSIIVGSNAGTSNGYQGLALSQDDVLDALIVGPGDPLMVRDGGYGGKVDIWIVPSALGSTALDPASNSNLSFTWGPGGLGQQFNNNFQFPFPLLPLDASQPVVVTASTSPSGSMTNVLLYEVNNPAPSGVAYMNPSGAGYHYTVNKANDLVTAFSVNANDYIQWNGTEMDYLRQYNSSNPSQPYTGNTMTVSIDYNYTSAVANLQSVLDDPNNKIITADVLAKEAIKIFIDVNMNVVLQPAYSQTAATTSSTLGLVRSALVSTINNITLGNTVQEADLVQAAMNVQGVNNVILSSVTVDQRYPSYFNVATEFVVDTTAQSNQYFEAGNILVTSV